MAIWESEVDVAEVENVEAGNAGGKRSTTEGGTECGFDSGNRHSAQMLGMERSDRGDPSELVGPIRNSATVSPSPAEGSRRSDKFSGRRAALLAGLLLIPGISFPLALGLAPKSDTEAATESTVPVRVGIVQPGQVTVPSLLSRFRGIVVPRRESDLAFRRPGRIDSILVDAGDSLEQGQVIAALDTAELDARMEVAKSELDLAQAQLQEAIEGPRQQTIESAEARVAQLKARYDASQRRLKRRQQLASADAVSDEEVQDESLLAEQFAASVREAEAELDQLREGTRREQLQAARARVAMAEAAVKVIRVQQDDSCIVAPFACVVSERFVDEGTIVDPNTLVVEILEQPPLEANFGLPAQVADSLQVGQQVHISVGKNADENVSRVSSSRSTSAAPGVKGIVTRMQPRVDPVTRTREVVVQFDAGDIALCGQPAAVWLPTVGSQGRSPVIRNSDDQPSFWIPSDALVRGVRGLWAVYVLVPSDQETSAQSLVGKTELRDVQVVQTAGLLTQIEGDIDVDDWLIMQGVQRIGPGILVAGSIVEQETLSIVRSTGVSP